MHVQKSHKNTVTHKKVFTSALGKHLESVLRYYHNMSSAYYLMEILEIGPTATVSVTENRRGDKLVVQL